MDQQYIPSRHESGGELASPFESRLRNSTFSGFVISGIDRKGSPQKETRQSAGSAAVIAMKWLAAGSSHVLLIDREGDSFDLKAFRQTFLEPKG